MKSRGSHPFNINVNFIKNRRSSVFQLDCCRVIGCLTHIMNCTRQKLWRSHGTSLCGKGSCSPSGPSLLRGFSRRKHQPPLGPTVGVSRASHCPLCLNGSESEGHLFFNCSLLLAGLFLLWFLPPPYSSPCLEVMHWLLEGVLEQHLPLLSMPFGWPRIASIFKKIYAFPEQNYLASL